MRHENKKDVKKLLELSRMGNLRKGQTDSNTFRVSDLVLFNGQKSFGHVLAVLDAGLHVIDD